MAKSFFPGEGAQVVDHLLDRAEGDGVDVRARGRPEGGQDVEQPAATPMTGPAAPGTPYPRPCPYQDYRRFENVQDDVSGPAGDAAGRNRPRPRPRRR